VLSTSSLHSHQELLPSVLLYKNVKIVILRAVISPFVSYGGATLISHIKRIFEKRILRGMFLPKSDKIIGG
jgi:hypothetical protein